MMFPHSVEHIHAWTGIISCYTPSIKLYLHLVKTSLRVFTEEWSQLDGDNVDFRRQAFGLLRIYWSAKETCSCCKRWVHKLLCPNSNEAGRYSFGKEHCHQSRNDEDGYCQVEWQAFILSSYLQDNQAATNKWETWHNEQWRKWQQMMGE